MNVGMQHTQKPGEIYCHINKNIKYAEGKKVFVCKTVIHFKNNKYPLKHEVYQATLCS